MPPQLTVAEQAALTSGRDAWHTTPVESAGLPALTLTDGPHGVRLQADPRDMLRGQPATCFPPAVATADYPKADDLAKYLANCIESFKEMADHGGKVGVKVTLSDVSGKPVFTAQTQAGGEFTFPAIAPAILPSVAGPEKVLRVAPADTVRCRQPRWASDRAG